MGDPSGYFRLQNWSQAHSVLYLTFAWLIWSVALAYVCLYFFTGHDMFRVHWFLSHPVFTPLARLTYNAYLVHLPLMMIVHGAQPVLPFFAGLNVMSEVIFFIVAAYCTSFLMYLIVEKPCMNVVADVLDTYKHRKQDPSSAQARSPEQRYHHLERQLSSLSDVDSETIAILNLHSERALPDVEVPLVTDVQD